MTKETLLADIAYARSGDKGDTSTIGVLAKTPEAYARLRELLTPERILRHFGGWASGAEVYEMPNIEAIQVVLHGALGGGATTTLRLDQTGKAMANNLLRLPLDS